MIQIIDNLNIIKLDDRNLAIVIGDAPRHPKKGYGNRIQGYYGSIQGAFKAALDIQIKSGATRVETIQILQAIDELHDRIDKLDYPSMMKLLKGASDEN